ncbi:MAG TPA: formate/nitrite transporter family protein [Thermoleophilia bacterium]|nr:formate/nitrite transporter family protein [Thermoleophilia bacterium]
MAAPLHNEPVAGAGSPAGSVDASDELLEARRRAAVSALVVHEAIRLEGEEELRRPLEAVAFSGLAAGLSMGFSFVAEGLLNAYLPAAQWAPLVIKLGYPVGFLIVILGRQQLFTETTVTVVLPLLSRRSSAVFWRVLQFWTVVLVANLAGALLFAWILGATDAYGPVVKQQFAQLGYAAVSPDFGGTVVRGVFAGWIVATVVWLQPVAGSARVAVIAVLTYLVGLANLSHIVAGSVETLFLVTTGRLAWVTWLGHFALPTLLGNTLGGVAFVAALNHAQAIAGRRRRTS